MKSKYKDLSLNTAVFMISSFGSKIISFFLVPLYTYVLTTSEYGMVDLATTTAQLLIPVLTLNVQDAVLRFSLDNNYRREDTLKVSAKILSVSSVFLLILLFAIKAIRLFSVDNRYLLFLFVLYLAGCMNNSLTMYLRAANKMKLIAVSGIVNTFITCGLNIILLLVAKLGVTGYMISYATGTLIADAIMILFGGIYGDLKKGQADKEIFKAMALYGIPLIANSIAWWINNASDRYILSYFCGAAVNGIYAVSYKIPSILAMVQSTFYNAWSVSAIVEFDKDDKDGFIGNVFSMYSCICVVGASAIMSFNVLLATILYSKDFFYAWKYVPLLLVGTVFNGLGLFIGCIFTAVKLTKDISTTTIIGATINTVLNILLIPWIGATGAAIATMIGYLTIFVMRLIRLKKIITMKVEWLLQGISYAVLVMQCILASLQTRIILQIPFLCILVMLNMRYFKGVYGFITKKIRKEN